MQYETSDLIGWYFHQLIKLVCRCLKLSVLSELKRRLREMFTPKSIQTDHEDLIHDVAYDFYGERLATCSSDQTVKIWDKTEDGQWQQSACWKAHTGSVWRVTWAHPEFGQVIATCSFDRTAGIWEELPCESRDETSKTKWVKRPNLVDSRSSVTDVKFAPKHLGLQLATCTSDGMVRIYQAPDVMNLSHWSLDYEIHCKLSCSSLSWNPSRSCPPMIAVGSDDTNPSAGGKVFVYQYNDQLRSWSKLQTLALVTDPVHDLTFSPNFGRSYHRLAIASKDLKIIQMVPFRQDSNLDTMTEYEISLVGQFDDHEHQVWRLSWNVFGTVLTSSGDDGKVRLWKANYLGNWKCISVLVGDIPSNVPESSSQSRLDLSPVGQASTMTSGASSNKRSNTDSASSNHREGGDLFGVSLQPIFRLPRGLTPLALGTRRRSSPAAVHRSAFARILDRRLS